MADAATMHIDTLIKYGNVGFRYDFEKCKSDRLPDCCFGSAHGTYRIASYHNRKENESNPFKQLSSFKGSVADTWILFSLLNPQCNCLELASKFPICFLEKAEKPFSRSRLNWQKMILLSLRQPCFSTASNATMSKP